MYQGFVDELCLLPQRVGTHVSKESLEVRGIAGAEQSDRDVWSLRPDRQRDAMIERVHGHT